MRSFLKKIGLIITVVVLWSTSAAAEDFNMFSAIKLGGTFEQTDLAGTWSMQALSMDGDDVLWLSADLVISTAGNVAGAGTDSDGDDFDVVGGLLVLNTFGIISGTFNILEGSTPTIFSIEDGKLDSAISGGSQLNNYAVLIASCSNCSPDRSLLIYLTRTGFSGFTQNFLQGLWRIFATGFENDTNRLLWIFGSFRIDSFGNVVTGSFQIENSRGQTGFFSTGQVLLEDNGTVTGFFEGTGSNDRSTFTGGQMTTDRNQITLVSADNNNEKLLVVLIRSSSDQGGLFADTDIDGSWNYYGIRFDTPANDADVSWEFGRLDMQNRGTITGADYTERDGSGGDITGDQIEVRVQGNLENGVIRLDGISRTVDSGQMNIPDFPTSTNPKSRFTFVGTDTGGSGGGGGGGGTVGVLPGQGTGGNGCLISASAGESLVFRILKRLERR